MNEQDKPLTFSHYYIKNLSQLFFSNVSSLNPPTQKRNQKHEKQQKKVKKQKKLSSPTQQELIQEAQNTINKEIFQNCSFSFNNFPSMVLYPADESTTIMQIFEWGSYKEYEHDIYYQSTKNFIHFNKQGQILDFIRINKQELPFCLKMLSQRLAVLLIQRPSPGDYQYIWESSQRNPEVILWNLEVNRKIQIDNIWCYANAIPYVYHFQRSSLFCVCIPNYFDSYVLKYYEYSQKKKIKAEEKHLFKFVIKSQKVNKFFYMPFQLDNISKLAIVCAEFKTGKINQKNLQIHTYQLKPGNLTGFCSQYCFEFDKQITEAISDKGYNIYISDLWLVRKNIFYITLHLGFDKFNEDIYENQIIVWKQYSYLWNCQSNESRKLTCQIPEEFYNVQFTHTLRDLKNFRIKVTSDELDPILKNKSNTNFQQIDLPVYFVSCFEQKQILVGKIQSNNQYVPMQFRRNLVTCYEGSNEGLKVTEIIVKNQDYEQAQLCIFLCLQLIDNCDEALLEQVYDLINQ